MGQSHGLTVGASSAVTVSTWDISASVSAALSVSRTMARLRLVAGAQNTAPNTPRASSASRSARVSDSVPTSSEMICSLPWWMA